VAFETLQPTLVRIGVMDSRKPQAIITLAARHLRLVERFRRAAWRLLVVSGVGLVVGNVAVLIFPLPHVHFCLVPISLIIGPIAGVVAWRDRALLASTDVHCPRCSELARVPPGLAGWPARFNCMHCSAMVELNLAQGR
jgi:hypothetical protein